MVVTVHIPTLIGEFGHIPTLTCGLTLTNPCSLTSTCGFVPKDPFYCARILAQFPAIPCKCPCGLALTSPIPCACVYLHIPLWVGKSLPTHSHTVCPTVTHISIHVLCVMVDANSLNMANPIHFSCHQQFQWVDPKAKNDMFIEYLRGIKLSPPTIILAKDMFGVHHVIRQLWDYNFLATYYHEGHTQDQFKLIPSNSLYTQPDMYLSLVSLIPLITIVIGKSL